MTEITTDPRRFDVPTPEDLRQLRLIAGLSIRETARRAEVEPNTVCRWEGGERSPRLQDVRVLLRIYKSEIGGQQQLQTA